MLAPPVTAMALLGACAIVVLACALATILALAISRAGMRNGATASAAIAGAAVGLAFGPMGLGTLWPSLHEDLLVGGRKERVGLEVQRARLDREVAVLRGSDVTHEAILSHVESSAYWINRLEESLRAARLEHARDMLRVQVGIVFAGFFLAAWAGAAHVANGSGADCPGRRARRAFVAGVIDAALSVAWWAGLLWLLVFVLGMGGYAKLCLLVLVCAPLGAASVFVPLAGAVRGVCAGHRVATAIARAARHGMTSLGLGAIVGVSLVHVLVTWPVGVAGTAAIAPFMACAALALGIVAAIVLPPGVRTLGCVRALVVLFFVPAASALLWATVDAGAVLRTLGPGGISLAVGVLAASLIEPMLAIAAARLAGRATHPHDVERSLARATGVTVMGAVGGAGPGSGLAIALLAPALVFGLAWDEAAPGLAASACLGLAMASLARELVGPAAERAAEALRARHHGTRA